MKQIYSSPDQEVILISLDTRMMISSDNASIQDFDEELI